MNTKVLSIILIIIGTGSLWQMYQLWEENHIWYVMFFLSSTIVIMIGLIGLLEPKKMGKMFK